MESNKPKTRDIKWSLINPRLNSSKMETNKPNSKIGLIWRPMNSTQQDDLKESKQIIT